MHNPKALRSEKTLMPWLIWFLAVLFYAYEFTQRVSVSIYLPYLTHDLNASSGALGVLGSSFYLAYASMQIPGGILIDTIGPKRLAILGISLVALGSFFFADIHTVGFGIVARTLIGLGSAFAFVCSMQFIIIWFPPARFAFLAGLTNLAGYAGAMIGEVPLNIAVDHFGWRRSAFSLAVIGFLLMILMAFIIRDKPYLYRKNISRHKKHAKNAHMPHIFHGLKSVLKNGTNWLNGLYTGLMMGPTSAFAAFWGVNFLTQVDHISRGAAGLALSAIFMGVAVGSPIFGGWSDAIKQRRSLLIFAASGAMCMTLALIFLNKVPIFYIYLFSFLFGFFQSAHVLNFANAKDINNRKNSGSALGFTNMIAILGGASLIPTIGFFLNWIHHGPKQIGVLLYSQGEYQFVFTVIPLCQFAALLIAIFFLKDSDINARWGKKVKRKAK